MGTAGTTETGVGILTERMCAEANTDARTRVINTIKRANVRTKVETTKERTQARAYQVIDAFKRRRGKRKECVDGKKTGPMWAYMRIMYQGGSFRPAQEERRTGASAGCRAAACSNVMAVDSGNGELTGERGHSKIRRCHGLLQQASQAQTTHCSRNLIRACGV